MRDGDFFFLRQHLQADGIEHHGDDNDAERTGQQQQGQAQDAEQRGQALDPGRVDLHRLDAGQGAQALGDGVDLRRGAGTGKAAQLHHVTVRQRVLAQRFQHAAQAAACLERFQRFFARHEHDFALALRDDLANLRQQRLCIGPADILAHEQADLGVDR